MKKLFFPLLLLLFVFAAAQTAFAQIKLPSQNQQTRTPQKQTTTVKTTTTQSSYSSPVLILKVTTDVACKFYVDGEYKSIIEPDEVEKINLQKGEYTLKAISISNPDKVVKQFYTVDATGIEKYYNIEFNKTTTLSDNKPSYSTDNASVTFFWKGPGSVKLYLDKEEHFLNEGQEKILTLMPDHPYTLKAVKPDKTYGLNDYLGFAKGEYYYEVGISYNNLYAVSSMSPANKAKNKIEADKAEYERLIKEARACPCQFVTAGIFSAEKPKQMVKTCNQAINAFNKARQYTKDNSKLRTLDNAIAEREETISSLKTEYYE